MKVQEHPESIKIWSEARRQSLAVSASSQVLDDQSFIDAISSWGVE
jgi:hypothetical protein